MCLFRKIRRRRLQKKFAKLEARMKEINELYGGCAAKDEVATAIYLLLNPSGDVSTLLDNGYDPVILEKFRTTGILNIPPNVSKENPYGKYSVTISGRGLLELTVGLNDLAN